MLADLNTIFSDALSAVMPERMIPAVMRLEDAIVHINDETFDLEQYGKLWLCGTGKAALPMAEACETILGSHIDGGIIVTPEAPRPLRYCEYVHSTHPLPSYESIAAANRLLDVFENAAEEDLILFLLSGGTSALIEKPLASVTLEEMAQSTKVLLENGCSIEETNSVRKHLSQIKGGRLAVQTAARVAVLVVSDVIGDDLQTIGSAPLYCDSSTYADTVALLEQKRLTEQLPASVMSVLRDGAAGKISETPKTPPEKVTHYMIGSNRIALEAAAASAADFGRDVRLVTTPLEGDVAEAVESFLEHFAALPPDTLLLMGGETTVTVSGGGQGGRNQHFALLCLKKLAGQHSYFDIICAGTDGIDGNSDAAGARINSELALRCSVREMEDALNRFDSNTFFEHCNAVINTGYTGTNVMDIVIAYKGEDNG